MHQKMASKAMTEVYGILFRDDVAPVVKELVERLNNDIGESHRFLNERQKEIKFALVPPSESRAKRKAAKALFFIIKATAKGADAVRPLIPKQNFFKQVPLTSSNIDAVHHAAIAWFHEVKQKRPSIGFQPTENRNVLPGGQFDSNHSKF